MEHFHVYELRANPRTGAEQKHRFAVVALKDLAELQYQPGGRYYVRGCFPNEKAIEQLPENARQHWRESCKLTPVYKSREYSRAFNTQYALDIYHALEAGYRDSIGSKRVDWSAWMDDLDQLQTIITYNINIRERIGK